MTNLPRLARLADLIVVLLGAGAVVVELTGGIVARPWGARVSLTSTWRILAWALLVLVLRHAWMRRPSLWQRLVSSGIVVDSGESFESPVPARTWPARLAMHAIVIGLFSALTCVAMIEQVSHLRSVADLGDPLFSIWRLDWVAYQLWNDPFHLFDANIFHPEPRTLAYSDAMLVPALVATPWLWMGGDPVVVHNVLMLATSASAGVTMFWLVRSLTRCTEAACVSGAVFALHPLRWALYSHLELQVTLWMPLALLGVHRTIASGRLRDGLATGLAVALQALSSLYYGLFLSVYVCVVVVSLALSAGVRLRRAVLPLVGGALLAGVLVAPVTVPYFQNRATVGERILAHSEQFSARPRDYVAAHSRSRVYGQVLPGQGKLELFPGIAATALAVRGLWLALSPGRFAYAAALGMAADASLGVNGSIYPMLYKLVLPFRGLRAPNRFAVFVAFSLAVLAGYGVARILRAVRNRRMRISLAAGLIAVVGLQSAPALNLTAVWPDVPPIYGNLPVHRDAVLVDLPFPQRDGPFWIEYSYLYFATVHHQRLVNGGSGSYPHWYNALADLMRDFPNDRAIEALRRHGAEYLVLHGSFFEADAYTKVIAAVERRHDLRLIAAKMWNGADCRLYEVLN